MRGLALNGTKDMAIRTLAIALTSGLLQHDYRAEACAIHKYVRDNIRYVRDIRSVETLQAARLTVLLAAGDCDDKSILLAALLGSLGHTGRFIAVSFMPNQYSHVWYQVKLGKTWVDLEATEPLDCGQSIPRASVIASLYQDV